MNVSDIDIYLIIKLLLLLGIGMGPNIAMVPFLDLTQGIDAETQKKIGTRMVKTAVGTALILLALGWLLMQALHLTPGSTSIAGGIVLLILALQMLSSPGENKQRVERSEEDLMMMAAYPLAVPYLLNPVGIAVLVIVSDQISSLVEAGVLLGVILWTAAVDFAVFRNMDKLSKRLDPARMAVTEAVFGILLTAVAVQMVVNGLDSLGIIALSAEH